MKRKIAYGIFVAAFFLLCIIPSAGMLLFGESEAAANEILTEKPELFYEDGSFNSSFTDDLTSYIADRFALRQQFITAYAKIQAAVFHESSSEDVVLGKDGWLFYEDTVDDYLRRDTLSQRQVQGVARTLFLMQQYAEERGVKFVFTVAPNKNSLYPEYMPNVGNASGQEKNLSMLEGAMEDLGVRYANLEEAFEGQPVLYYRMDSHWNSLGAALAFRTIADELQLSVYPWFEESCRKEKNHLGDLYEMLFPAGKELEEDVVFDRKFGFRYLENRGGAPSSGTAGASSAGAAGESSAGAGDAGGTADTAGEAVIDYYSVEAPAADSIRIDTEREGGSESILMFRDSFGNNLYPFFADAAQRATFSRLMPYRMDWLDAGEYSCIVVEIVERNLRNLAEKAPVMGAPQISSDDDVIAMVRSAELSEDVTAEAQISPSTELAGYCTVTGGYDPEKIDPDTRIFIETGDSVYEAFPVGTGSARFSSDACFTAYIPQEVLNENDFSVILCKNGTFCRASCEITWK